jgi:hypothetical protein
MALTRAIAASGESVTNTENYVSSALTIPVQVYLPVVNAGATTTVAVGDRIEFESTAGGSIEVLTAAGRRVGVVPGYGSAIAVAQQGTVQSADDTWTFTPMPQMNSSADRWADIEITSAELLALNATPKAILAAPGANKAIIFQGAMLYKPAGTAYAGIAVGEDLAFCYTNLSGIDVAVSETTGFLDQATAQSRYARAQTGALAAATVSDFTPVANAALVLGLLAGEITTGDTSLFVRVFYRIVPTVLTK